MLFGVPALIIPFITISLALFSWFSLKQRFMEKSFWLILVLIALSSLVSLYPEGWERLCEHFNIAGVPGGLIGWIIGSNFLASIFGNTGATVLLVAILIIALVIGIGRTVVVAICKAIASYVALLWKKITAQHDNEEEIIETIEKETRLLEKQKRELERKIGAGKIGTEVPRRKIQAADKHEAHHEIPISEAALPPPSPLMPQATATSQEDLKEKKGKDISSVLPAAPQSAREDSKLKKESPEEKPLASQQLFVSYQLPPLSLLPALPEASERAIESDTSATSNVIIATLAEFGIEAEIKHVETGPTVTRYEILPAPGVRVERIAQLSNNLALNLKASSIRVQAPIPGKGVVGIEVPNSSATRVYLKEIMESDTWQNTKAAIPLALGKDVGGHEIIADLAAMPHLLIAGATGSGKTVCMNSILAGMLFSRTPNQLRLMLVDPKMVEFAAYNDLPHLICRVITDPKKVPLGLRYAIAEMERRYQLLAKAGVRSIHGYNSRPEAIQQPQQNPAAPENNPDSTIENALKEEELFSTKTTLPPTLPYIVIVIDELADLMLVAQADVESYIARLAQLSRAVGIHMILATQRPSVNVITGTIKANFPARISFQVAQKVDSRTILDTIGADKLLGKGDMLFLPPGSSKLIRAQGAMTTDEDIRVLVNFIKKQSPPNYELAIQQKNASSNSSSTFLTDESSDDEELLDAAIEVIRETKRASVSLLQRRLRIGYNRAGRLMDALEEKGIVGPGKGSDPREILIDLDITQPSPSNEENEI
jgi:S-DNA-T family DNA segregation ATPase FtsK/SpoIIIE